MRGMVDVRVRYVSDVNTDVDVNDNISDNG